MAFGPIMRLSVPQKNQASALAVELAPLEKEAMRHYVTNGGMQSYTVTRFLAPHRTAPVLEDEHEWYDKTRASKDSVLWGIWLIDGDTRTLIGSTGLDAIEHGPSGMKQASSGSLIFDQRYWGKGIASAAHKARTWFAFSELGLTRIKSAVFDGNDGSRKALERSGYIHVYTERNTGFTDGKLIHNVNLECLNPLEPFWSHWWGVDMPTEQALKGRDITHAALEWARDGVTLT